MGCRGRRHHRARAGGFVKEIDGGDFLQTGALIAANERLLPLLTKTVRGA